MTIHKEGTATIALTALVVGALNIANFSYLFPISTIAAWAVFVVTLGLFLFIVSFFRMPSRNWTKDASAIVSPADGKVVVIEEVEPDENQQAKKKNISALIEEMRKLVTSTRDVVTVGPIITQLIEASISNDDHLIKIANIAQKLVLANTKRSRYCLSKRSRRKNFYH